MALKRVLVYKNVFQKCLEKDTSGTGGNVPGRYGGKLEKLFWPYEMVGKENGSPLPNSLQKKLVLKKVFNKDIEMSYSREEPPLAPCRPRIVPVPCYCQIAYPLLLSKVVCEYNS